MKIKQFIALKEGDKIIIDGKENEVKTNYGLDQIDIVKHVELGRKRLEETIDCVLDEKIVKEMKLITVVTVKVDFDFSTLKDSTFCIYDVKEGQADKI